MTPNLFRRIAEWWSRPPAPACYDCGASIIAADDDALVCIQCGGRNRRVGHRVGSNPPPPVGVKPVPSPGPPRRYVQPEPDCRNSTDRQERHETIGPTREEWLAAVDRLQKIRDQQTAEIEALKARVIDLDQRRAELKRAADSEAEINALLRERIRALEGASK